MAQPITAQFITDTWFATWLSPTVSISTVDWTIIGSYPMIETSTGNYLYMFDWYNDSIVYFFSYDANDDTVLNRYQGSNNNIPSVVYQMAWGVNAIANEEEIKEKKLIEKIKKELEKEFKDIKDNQKTIVETLGMIVENQSKNDIEFDDSTILNSIEENTKLVQKKIDSIKIPTYKESIVIDAVTKDIKSIDIPNYDTTLEDMHSKLDIIKNIVMLDPEYEIKKYIENEIENENIIKQIVNDNNILESLLETQDDGNES